MTFGPTRTTQIVNSGAQTLFVTDEEISRNSAVTWHIHCHCACERLTVIESQYDVLHEL